MGVGRPGSGRLGVQQGRGVCGGDLGADIPAEVRAEFLAIARYVTARDY